MARPESPRNGSAESIKRAAHPINKPLRRLQSNVEVYRSSSLFTPSPADPVADPVPQRCRSLSPLNSSTPVLSTQRSMVTMSNDSFRSPSALDDIPANLLRRYPRFSTATTSIDTGRPDFSIGELTSTQLSEDEDDIVNDEPERPSMGSRVLMKYRIARDVRALWSSNTSRLRYARQRLKRRQSRSANDAHVQPLSPADSKGSPSARDHAPLPSLALNGLTNPEDTTQVRDELASPVYHQIH